MGLPTVPSCSPEDPCDALPFITIGKALQVSDPLSECPKNLEGSGLALQDSQGIRLASGAKGNPVKLPDMQVLKEGATFPYLMLMNKAGEMFRLSPNQDGRKFTVISKQGSFQLVQDLNEPCFNDADICSDCEPTFLAGIKVNDDGTACLIKLPLSNSIDFWEDSNCIAITGSGTEADPYVASVVISPDEGNALQCTENGLFVAQASS